MTASFTLLVLSSKDRGASSPSILYPKEESGSHCLLILDLKPRSAGLKFGSTIILGLIKILRIKFTIFGLRKKGNIAPHVIAMMVFRANDGVV